MSSKRELSGTRLGGGLRLGRARDDKQPVTQTYSQTFVEAETFSETVSQKAERYQPPADLVADLREAAARGGRRRPRLEDTRRRQTYWLDDEEIRMVAELASATGRSKYEVVSTAVRALHAEVFGHPTHRS